MNEKVYIQDLVNLVAERQGITKKEAENFLKTMFDLIEEVLNEDQFVKIKGLGTFKLTKVGSRESIDVNTGERFVIEGHTKLSFIPENSVRDLINKPFSHFETVILNDNTVFEDDEEEEKEDLQDDESEEQDETNEVEVTDNRITTQNDQEEEEKGQEADHTSIIAEETCIAEEVSVASVSVESSVEDIKPDNETTTNQTNTTDTSLSEKEEADINLSTTGLETTKVEEEVRTDDKQNTEITKNEKVEQPIPTISISSEDELPDEKEKTEAPEEKILSVKEDSNEEQAVPVTKRKNRAISYIIVLLVTVLMLTGITFYIFKPNIINVFFNDDKDSQLITEAEVSPVVPEEAEIIPNDTVENTILSEDTLAVIDPSVSSTEVPVPEEKVIIEEEIIPSPVKTPVQPTMRPPVDDLTKTIITGIREDAAEVIPDSTSYVIVGTMDQYTVRVGETLTRISHRYYRTKDLWPYLVMHNRGVITNPDNVPVGTTIKIPALRDKK